MELELPELAPFAVRAEQAPYSLSGPGVELPFDAFSVIARGDVVWRVVDGGPTWVR